MRLEKRNMKSLYCNLYRLMDQSTKNHLRGPPVTLDLDPKSTPVSLISLIYSYNLVIVDGAAGKRCTCPTNGK